MIRPAHLSIPRARPLRFANLLAGTVCLLLGLSIGARAGNPSDDVGPWLQFSVGMDSTASPIGALFVVELEHKGEITEVYRAIWNQQLWLPQAVNLKDYAGQDVILRFKTLAVYNMSGNCYSMWGSPELTLGPLSNPKIVTALTELEPKNYAGSSTAQIDIESNPDAGEGLKLAAVKRGDTSLSNGGTKTALFAHPWYINGQAFHILEYAVKIPARPSTSTPAAPAKSGPPTPKRSTDFAITDYQSVTSVVRKGLLAEADPSERVLSVSMGALGEDGNPSLGYAYAGFQISGSDELVLKVTVDPSGPASTPQYSGSENAFAGLILDFHTAEGWSKRIFMNSAENNSEITRSDRRAPIWNLAPETITDVEEVNRQVLYQSLSIVADGTRLKLKELAPEGWDGQVWVAVGVQDVEENASVKLTILESKPKNP